MGRTRPTIVRSTRLASSFVAGLVLLLGVPSPGRATDYVVQTFVDGVVIDGQCGLREAIRAASSNATVDTCPAGSSSDSILLPSGDYVFDQGFELLDDAATIEFEGVDPARIDMSQSGSFLEIRNGSSVSISSLTLMNAVGGFSGALVAAASNLVLQDVVFQNNVGNQQGGGLQYFASSPHSLRIERTTFLGNACATGAGAQISVRDGATAELRDVSFFENTGAAGVGLVLHAGPDSSAICARCAFEENFATGGAAGAILNAGEGGAVRLVDATFRANDTGTGAHPPVATFIAEVYDAGIVEIDRLISTDGGASGGDSVVDALLLANSPATIVLRNSVVAAGWGNGVEARASDSGLIEIAHSTIAGFQIGATLIGQPDALIRLEQSIVALNTVDILLTPTGVELGTNFSGADPMFDSSSPPFQLSPASPAIDFCGLPGAGSRVADAAHRPRFVGSELDCGAYETGSGFFADDFESGDAGSWSSETAARR